MATNLDIRPSPIAGRWYPAEKQALASSVDGYLDAARLPETQGEVIAVMAPHAGHLYSGPVAGHAFAALRGRRPEVVAVVSPMHYPYPQPLITCAHSAYETPLGLLPVDQATIQALNACLEAQLGYGLAAIREDPEHALEIELPFLQRALRDDFKLLPIMVRDQTVPVARALGHALAQVLAGRDAVLVASTDLSHFYPQTTAEALDAEVLRQVEAFDPAGVMAVEEKGRGFACGRSALAAVLWAARELGADQARILCHATSGDVTGDYSRVVGYAAAAFLRRTERDQVS
jgi:AmmeMemoRadiSam system protein B